MATRLAELRCPCGPSKRGRFLCRYRATVLVPAPIEGVEDPAESPNDLVIKCRHCKRFYALVGVRYVGAFAERWSYLVRADASAGGTNLSWSAGAGVFWGFGENQRYAVALGYRHLDIDFDPDQGAAEVDVEMTLSGVMAGVRFSF